MERIKKTSQPEILKAKKRIRKIYSEISRGLQQKSMKIEMVRIKISEANLLISEIEQFIDQPALRRSIYE